MTQRLAFAALAFALLAHAAPRAHAQAPAAKDARDSASVSGRITSGDGQPLAGVALVLSPQEFPAAADRARPPARATTDADGRYRIAGVGAGRYRLQTLAPAYTINDTRLPGFNNPGKTVTLAPGEAVEGVDLVLTRGGVITGRVTDSEGKPVIAERVAVVIAEMRDQTGPAAWAASFFEFETDDRGVYRVFGLAPGRYVVSVGQDRGGGTISVGVDASPYTRTFYPATTDPAQARVVEVSSGGESSGVDITMAEAPRRYAARGRVVDEAGKPVAGVATGYGVLREGSRTVGGWGSDGSHTDSDGEFVIRNLPPGRYAAFVVNEFGAAPGDNYSDAATFEIADADVSGLVIKTRRGSSISGTVTVEGTTDRAVLARVARLQINLRVDPSTMRDPEDGTIFAPINAQLRINPDGTFRASGLRAGRYRFDFFNFNPESRGFSLVGVERGGADAVRGVEVGPGENVTGVRVRLGYGAGVVRGTVEVRDGSQPASLPEGMRMFVTARRAGTAETPYGTRAYEVDERGRFTAEGLVAGEYELSVGLSPVRLPGVPSVAPARFPPVRQTVVVPGTGETTVTIFYDLSKTTERRP